jgi:dihydrofolate reductase
MSRFLYYVAASVDGYIADEQESLDWLTRYDGGEGVTQAMNDFMAGVGSIVMGADTYSWMLAHLKGEWPYPGIPTWVFTHRELAAFPGADLTFIRGDVAEWVRDVADDAGDKDVWVVGGGSLAGQLADEGFIDELILTTIPVVLGGGRRLFASRGQIWLEPTASREFERGVREERFELVKPPRADRVH